MSVRVELVDYLDDSTSPPTPLVRAETTVSWDRVFGRCDRRTFHKSGTIYTQSRLRAWLKKYQPYIADDEKEAMVSLLPKSVWWE